MRSAALLVALVAAIVVAPAASRSINTSCKDYAAGTDCEMHECTSCMMDLGITKISFCVESSTAETLPKGRPLFLKHSGRHWYRPLRLPSFHQNPLLSRDVHMW
jgi:hypothetical protein